MRLPIIEGDAEDEGQQDEEGLLSPSRIRLMQNVIRCWAPSIMKGNADLWHGEPFVLGVVDWLDRLHTDLLGEDHIAEASRGRWGFSYKSAFLVQVVILADLLIDDGKLAEVLDRATTAFMPESIRAWWSEARSTDFKIPTASTVSKARLPFDAAFCRVWQTRFEAGYPPIFMLADSSPQFKRDWLTGPFNGVDTFGFMKWVRRDRTIGHTLSASESCKLTTQFQQVHCRVHVHRR